jgi:hypothetical protein
MTCALVRPSLLDVALGEPAARDLRAHLEGCAGCRVALEDEKGRLAQIDGALREGLDVRPSPAFVAGARLRAAETPHAIGGFAHALLPAAIAIAGLLMAGALLHRGPAAHDVPTTTTAAGEARREAPPRPEPPPVIQAAMPARAASPASRGSARRPRSRAVPEELPTVLVSPEDQQAFALLIERLTAVPDDALAEGLRVSDREAPPFAPLGELPPVVVPPLARSDS